MKNDKILIVDDIHLNRLVLSQYIKNFDYNNILFASNGKESIDIVKNNKDILLIFMDIRMPEMSGDQASFIIKNEINSKIPIVAVTAYDTNSFNNKVFNDVITKPIVINNVRDILKKYL